MKSRAKHVIKNAEWYSFLRQALRRQVRHIPRSFVVRKQSAWLSSWRSLRTSLNGGRGREERSTIRPNVSQAFNVRTKNFAMEMETGDDDDGGRMVDASHDFGHDASGIWCVNEGCSWCSLIKACVCVRVFFLFFFFSVETRYEFSMWRLSGNSYERCSLGILWCLSWKYIGWRVFWL